MKHIARRSGFTLMELLIVIAVIGILAGMLFPAVNFTRERARKNECLNNLRQWCFALQGYLDDHHGRFPSYGGTKPDPQQTDAWYNVLPPYIGIASLKDMGEKLPCPGSGLKSVFLCPSESVGLGNDDASQNTEYFSSYTLNTWTTGLRLSVLNERHNPPVSPSSFVAFAETGDGRAGGVNLGVLSAAGEIAFRHSRSFNVGFADGHVENVHMNVALPQNGMGANANAGGLHWCPNTPFAAK